MIHASTDAASAGDRCQAQRSGSHQLAWVRGVLCVGCLLLAGVGQVLLDRRKHLWAAAILYVFATILFVVVFRRRCTEAQRSAKASPAVIVAWPYLVAAVGLAALSFPRFAGNKFTPEGTLLWGISLLLLGVGALPAGLWGRLSPATWQAFLVSRRRGLSLSWYGLGVIGAMGLAAYLRLYRIADLPSEMGCDLPHVYSNVQAILAGEHSVFFPSHPGREGLFFYVTAACARIWGLSHTSIKVSSALVGLATLPALYALGKELFGRGVGLGATYLASISHWHIIASRSGLRAVTLPLLMILAWLWLMRGLRTRHKWWFYLSGLATGLGMYTYNAFVMVPLFVGTVLLGQVCVRRDGRAGSISTNVVLLAVAALVVLVPLGRYVYENPSMYTYRAATRVTGLERPLGQGLAGVFLQNMARGFLMFNYRGDSVYATNVPFLRELGFFTSILFVLGLGLLVWRLGRGHNLSVLLALGIMLVPMTLSLAFPDEVPNAYRGIGTWPSAMLLAAVGLDCFWGVAADPVARRLIPRDDIIGGPGRRDSRLFDLAPATAFGLVLLALMSYEAVDSGKTYFVDFAWHQPRHNYSISLAMARAIDEYRQGEAYIVSKPHWYDGNAVRAQFRVQDHDWDNELLALSPGGPPLHDDTTDVMVLVHPDDLASQGLLHEFYPRGVFVEHLDNDGRVAFLAFYGER